MVENLHSVMEAVRQKAEQIAKRRLVRQLKSVGEECVAEAVSAGNYEDKTCNLRSSIGFVVADDGNVVEEGGFFNLGGSEGPDAGREKAYAHATGTQGVVLIIVAGMKYAQYVADRGYNVLDSAEILAQNLLASLAS